MNMEQSSVLDRMYLLGKYLHHQLNELDVMQWKRFYSSILDHRDQQHHQDLNKNNEIQLPDSLHAV